MSVVDQERNVLSFSKVDKFIEIEFKKANESGQVFFIQMARGPGF